MFVHATKYLNTTDKLSKLYNYKAMQRLVHPDERKREEFLAINGKYENIMIDMDNQKSYDDLIWGFLSYKKIILGHKQNDNRVAELNKRIKKLQSQFNENVSNAPVSPGKYQNTLSTCDDESVRKSVYIARNSHAPENKTVLKELYGIQMKFIGIAKELIGN